jgi:hypothetical protein
MEVKDEVQFADISKILIQDLKHLVPQRHQRTCETARKRLYLHKKMDCFQTSELIIVDINTEGEEKSSISPIDQLVGLPFHKIRELCLTLGHNLMALLLFCKWEKCQDTNPIQTKL